MTSDQAAAPIATDERSSLLDSLRGLALAGILVANMMVFTGYFFLDEARRGTTLFNAPDPVVEFLFEWLVAGKFYSIFSLLFGIGFAIQLERLEARGEGVPRYLRRLLILFLIGLAHMLLLWMGDIVALYALMGAVLLLFRRASDRTLLIAALLCWLIPIGWSAMIHFARIDPSEPLYGVAMAMFGALGAVADGPLAHDRNPDLLLHLRTHPAEIIFRYADLLYQMRFTKVLGMFLIGYWVGRRAIYAHLDQHCLLLRRVAWVGLVVGLPASLLKAIFTMWPGEDPSIEFLAEAFYVLGTPTLALGYVAGVCLLWSAGRRCWFAWAAPAGRMALTNYLAQTIVQSITFYGWGFALMGKLGLIFVLPIAAAIFAIQVAWSAKWLARYRFGPVEWLWRSLTYGKAQPQRAIA